MNTCVYDKTEKGREEIATRKYHVPARLRTLLVMIDGRHPLDDLLKNFAPLGLTEASIDELVQQEYIRLVSSGPAEAPVARKPPAAARARMAARRAPPARGPSIDQRSQEEQNTLLDALLAEAAMADPDPAPVVTLDHAERLRALHAFYNQTIKNTIGLRGLVLQLRVEKCADIDDLRLLRTAYLEAVYKAKGREITLSLRDRLDQLLGGAPEPDPYQVPPA